MTSEKRQYEKPRLRIIELTAEELMGQKCKFSPTEKGVNPNGCAYCSATGS